MLCWLHACSAPEPRHPRAAHPIDEDRAVAVIARVLQEAGDDPAEGRDMRLRTGRLLRIDVATSSRRYGVAYLTAEDRSGLQPSDLPPRASGNDFWVTQGAEADGDAVVLLLDAADYQYDESTAESEAAAIRVERRLARDVHEFITIVRAKKLP